MSLDLAINLATEDYIKTINEINKKYNLPLSVIEIILRDILTEVSNSKMVQINQEKARLAEEEAKQKKEGEPVNQLEDKNKEK